MEKNFLNSKKILKMIENHEISAKEGFEIYKKLQEKNYDNNEIYRKTDIKSSNSRVLYYQSRWEKYDLVNVQIKEGYIRNILIFDIEDDIYNALKERLSKGNITNIEVFLVKPGHKYKESNNRIYEVNPGSIHDYQKLSESLVNHDVGTWRIIHNWSHDSFKNESKVLAEQFKMSIFSVFYLSQAIMKSSFKNQIQILYFYLRNENEFQPHYAAVSGFARSIYLENPQFIYKVIGIQHNKGSIYNTHVIDVALNEFNSETDYGIEINYQNGERYVRCLKRFDLGNGKKAEVSLPFKNDGVYLISGGIGGLGLIFAEYISKRVNARLVLTGRSDLNAEKESKIEEIKKRGSEVLYIKSDISISEEVEELISKINSRYGVLNGIIHCAGINRDSFILKKSNDEMKEVFASKIYGTLNLDESTKKDNLDFFILFSSIAGVLGNIGQSDYAFSNSFMDNYAEMRESLRKKGERFGKCLSINWPLWQEGGMNIDEDLKAFMIDSMGLNPLSTDNGLKAFDDGFRFNSFQMIVVEGEESKVGNILNNAHVRHHIIKNKNIIEKDLLLSGKDGLELYKKTENFLKGILSKEIKLSVQKIQSEELLEKYGINSVMILNLTRELEKNFGELSKTLFFEYKNIKELSDYFIDNHTAQLLELIGDHKNFNSITSTVIDKKIKEREGRVRFIKSDVSSLKKEYTSNNIAIIGLSGKYPGANNIDEFWKNLKSGKDCIIEIPQERWDYNDYYDSDKNALGKSYCKWGGFIEDVDKFDSLFFNISPRDAEFMDPQERLFLEIVWQALEDSGYTRSLLKKEIIGVFVGVMYGEYQLCEAELHGNTLYPIASYASIANRVSFYYNFSGPSIALDTMCSSSLTSIYYGCKSIENDDCTIAVAGGVNVSIHPNKYNQLSMGKFSSSDGRCKSFGEGGDGYVPGEGVGAVILKPLDKAILDNDNIYGVIKSGAINHGGKTNGYTVPNPKAQADLILKALTRVKYDARTISYIEAHGTGTSLGDPIEITGLAKSFTKHTKDKQYCSIGSVKSNVGHLESAAGIAGLTKVLLQMKYKQLVPTIHTEILNPNIKFDTTPFYVQRELTDWLQPILVEDGKEKKYPRRAGISAFGAGGANAHLIIEEYEDLSPVVQDNKINIIVLSAKTKERLNIYVRNILAFLENKKQSDEAINNRLLVNMAFTLQVGRESMEERLAFTVSSIIEMETKLRNYCNDDSKINNIYRGNIDNLESNSLLDINGEEKEELLRNIINNKDYDRLCELWVSGLEVNWMLLYGDHTPKRISLPTYPFERKRYWVTENGINFKFINKRGQRSILHSLIDSNESTLEKQSYKKRLVKDEFYLRDHLVNKINVLPGAVHIEMVRIAGSLANKKWEVRKLTNIFFIAPIEVTDSSLDIFINLYPVKDFIEFEITRTNNDEQKIIHSKGCLNYTGNDIDTIECIAYDIEQIKERCSRKINAAECYDIFNNAGLTYGVSFKVIKDLYINNNEALSLIELPHEFISEEKAEFLLHPSLLDGAFQTVVGLLANDISKTDELFLPFSIGDMEIIKSIPERCYAYVSLSNNDDNAQIKNFNITILDEAGHSVLRINNYSLRAYHQQSKRVDHEINSTLYYKSEWKRSEENNDVNKEDVSGNILIFDIDNELNSILTKELNKKKSKNVNVILVNPGKGFEYIGNSHYLINPSIKDDYYQLMENLKEKKIVPNKILHIWSRDMYSNNEEALRTQLHKGVFSILFLTQSLMELFPEDTIRMLYIYFSRDKYFQPLYAGLSGFIKTLHLENPKFLFSSVAVSLSSKEHTVTPKKIAHVALREFQSGERDVDVAYKGSERFTRHLVEFDPLKEIHDTVSLKDNGVYLITGGTGGLGLIFAEYISKQVKSKLILTGRSDLTSAKKLKIDKIISSGSEVLYIKADVSKHEDVERLLLEIKSQYGSINGIIHSAGITHDSFLLKKTYDDMLSVLASKVYGTIYLDEATKDENIDFMALFSSTTAVTGNVGQSDYAYANSFMDSFAHMRESMRAEGKRKGKSISINWPLWEQGGMQIDEHSIDWMKEVMGIVPLRNESGIKAFEYGLQLHVSQLMILEGEAEKIKKKFSINKLEDSSIEQDAVELSDNDIIGIQEKAEAYIKEIISKEIKLSVREISSKKSWDQYGIESVLIMNLIRELEKSFGELPKTIFFEYKNIKELAQYFTKFYTKKLIEMLGDSSVIHQKRSEIIDLNLNDRNKLSDTNRSRFFNQSDLYREHENVYTSDIAIIGLDGRYPGAKDINGFWENIKSGKDCISEIPRERWDYNTYYHPDKERLDTTYSKWGGFIDDIDKFDSLFFSIIPREAELIDPQERLFLETVWKSIEDAGYTKNSIGRNVGVYVGVMWGEYQLLGATTSQNAKYPSSSYASIANRVSYYFDFTGPSLAVDTMCSSSLTALYLACEAIYKGEIEAGIVGGVNLSLHPSKYIKLSSGGFTSSDGRCRSFGDGGDGYVPGEGVGAILIKPLYKAVSARDHIYAVIKGVSINHGGKTSGYFVPDPNAQADVISATLKKVKIDPRTISYLEAHGTGTSLGDPIEIAGLIKAFSQYTNDKQYCSIGSVKSNIGHLESAAGISALTKVLLQMKYKQLVPSLHSAQLNPYIKFNDSPFYVQSEVKEWKEPVINGKKYPRRAGLSSFGAGGSNAHVILEEYESFMQGSVEAEKQQIIVISAKNDERIKTYAKILLDFLNTLYHTDSDKHIYGKMEFELLNIFSELINVNISHIELGENMSDYGFDPVKLTRFVECINNKYNIDIKSALSVEYPSLKSFAHYIFEEYNKEILLYYSKVLPSHAERLKIDHTANLVDIAYTLQVGREAMQERFAVIVSSIDELRIKLSDYCNGKKNIENSYKGNATNEGNTEILLNGKEGEEFIRNIINNSNLNKLAYLWVSGIDIDWNLLYKNEMPQRISLPTYPFERKRHWIDVIKGERYVHEKELSIKDRNPLVNFQSLNLGPQRFITELTGKEFYLMDYQTDGYTILPGLAYIEMIRAAGEIALNKFVYKIKDVMWTKPIQLHEFPHKMSINIYLNGKEAKYEVATVNKNDTIVHTQGKIVYDNNPTNITENNIINIDEFKKHSIDLINGTDFYNLIQKNGYKYKKSFRVIKELYYTKTEVLAKLELPYELKSDFRQFVLHPTMIDSAIQSLIFLINNKERNNNTLYVPFKLDEINIIDALEEISFVYLNLSSHSPSGNRCNIVFLNESGKVLVTMKDLFIKLFQQDDSNAQIVYNNEIKHIQENSDEYIMNLLHKLKMKEIDIYEADKLIESTDGENNEK